MVNVAQHGFLTFDLEISIFVELRGVSEKVLHRLEQLDLDTGSRQFYGGLTQEEYALKVGHE